MYRRDQGIGGRMQRGASYSQTEGVGQGSLNGSLSSYFCQASRFYQGLTVCIGD